jgi:hypothetical protein
MVGSFGQLLGDWSALSIDEGGSSVFTGPAILIACSLEPCLTVTSVQCQLGIETEQLPLSRASSRTVAADALARWQKRFSPASESDVMV